MPGRLVPLITGEYYHIFNRGVNKQPIFLGKKSYKRCLELLKYYKHDKTPVSFSKLLLLNKENQVEIWKRILKRKTELVDVISFCLMPNHFHLILKQNSEDGISKFMSNFQNSYTRFFNLKNDRVGPLLQGQFKAVRVEDTEQLIHLSRYIHLNPYTGFVVKEFSDVLGYTWSSLPEYLDTSDVELASSQVVLENFKSVEDYQVFIKDQADYQRELARIKHLTLE